MSLTVLMVLCILALDLLIYVLVRRVYGDKRIALASQIAILKEQSPTTFSAPVNTGPITRSQEPTDSSAECTPRDTRRRTGVTNDSSDRTAYNGVNWKSSGRRL